MDMIKVVIFKIQRHLQLGNDVISSVQLKLENSYMKGWGYLWIVLSYVLQMHLLLASKAPWRPT